MAYRQEHSGRAAPEDNSALNFLASVYRDPVHGFKRILPSKILSPVFTLINLPEKYLCPARLAALSGHRRKDSIFPRILEVLKEQQLVVAIAPMRERPNVIKPRFKYEAAPQLPALAFGYNKLYCKTIGDAVEPPMSENQVRQVTLQKYSAVYRTTHNLAPDIPARDTLHLLCQTEKLHPQTVIHEALGAFAIERGVLDKAQDALYVAAQARVR